MVHLWNMCSGEHRRACSSAMTAFGSAFINFRCYTLPKIENVYANAHHKLVRFLAKIVVRFADKTAVLRATFLLSFLHSFFIVGLIMSDAGMMSFRFLSV